MAKKPEKTSNLPLLKADLKNGTFRKLYFFYGEERYLQEYYLSMLKKKLVSGPMESFNYRRLTAETMSVSALQDSVEAMPVMAEYVMVQVDDYNPFAQDEETRKAFIAIIEDLPEGCCLVMNYDTVPFTRDGKMRKLAGAIDEYGCCVEFEKQTPRELCDWIARHFKTEGKNIAPDVCQYLLFVTDGTMTTLGMEIKKIASYCVGQTVTKADIDAVVEPALSAVAFDITGAIAEGDYGTALKKMREVLRTGEEAISVLGVIAGHFRRILIARIVASAGRGGDTLMTIIGSNSEYYAGMLMKRAAHMDDSFCRRAVELCYKADAQIKLSYDDKQVILEQLLLTLAVEGKT